MKALLEETFPNTYRGFVTFFAHKFTPPKRNLQVDTNENYQYDLYNKMKNKAKIQETKAGMFQLIVQPL